MIDTTYRGWKRESKDRCREILNDATIGSRLNDCDCIWLEQVLELHPEADDKFGCGVDYFEVRKNGYGGRTFWIIRTDGTATDFSFMRCISAGHAMADFNKACRTAVAQDIIAFKNSVFDGREYTVCPVLGERIFRDTCHIDHAPPHTFETIVEEFAATLTNPIACVRPTRDGETVTRLIDDDLVQEFRELHGRLAELRAVSKYANLSTLRRKQ